MEIDQNGMVRCCAIAIRMATPPEEGKLAEFSQLPPAYKEYVQKMFGILCEHHFLGLIPNKADGDADFFVVWEAPKDEHLALNCYNALKAEGVDVMLVKNAVNIPAAAFSENQKPLPQA